MFIFNIFGPALKYRLDLFDYAAPKIRDRVIIMTNRDSYKFYKEYHNKYEFVMIEDYKDSYPVSKKYEILPEGFINEYDHFKRLKSFYAEKNKMYFYDVHRFAFPILEERGIKNFCIIDSDFTIVNNRDKIEKFFTEIDEGTLYAPPMGWDYSSLVEKHFFWQQVKDSQKITNLSMDIPFGSIDHPHYPLEKHYDLFLQKIISSINDGWIRGFNFRTTEDMRLFFKLWNGALEQLMVNSYESNGENYLSTKIGNVHKMILTTTGMDHRSFWGLEWITSTLMAIFRRELNYTFNTHVAQQPGDLCINNSHVIIAKHRPRVEDNLYWGSYNKRGAWYYNDFNYEDTSTITNFIRNNMDEIVDYYEQYNFKVHPTSTHIYTTIKE